MRQKQSTKDYHDFNSNCITLCMGKQEVHSTEAGTLAPEFEKLATDLKPKPKLLGYKNI